MITIKRIIRRLYRRYTRRTRFAMSVGVLRQMNRSLPCNFWHMSEQEHNDWMRLSKRIDRRYKLLKSVGEKWGITP